MNRSLTNQQNEAGIQKRMARVMATTMMFVVTLMLSTELNAQNTDNGFSPAAFQVPAGGGIELNAPVAAQPLRVAQLDPPQQDSGFSLPDEESLASAAESETLAAPPSPTTAPNLFDILRSGGPLMIPIGLGSFLLVVFVFERFISLRRSRIIPTQFTRLFLTQLNNGELDQDAAEILCDRDNSPMAHVFKAGIQKWGRPAVEVEQAVLDEGERTSNKLRKYLRLINGVATLSPLFGLLGTVLGMIYAFDSIAQASASAVDPKALIATGISQALLTTAAGLSVAIPALIAYLFFSSRVDKHIMDIDALGMQVVNLISAEAISAESESKPRSRKKAA